MIKKTTMYGMKELKQAIRIDANSVECPVKGCSVSVNRQRQSFKTDVIFKCPIHKIYISPSTFQYSTEAENLLWTDSADQKLFSDISKVKRESRIARDNSEDALTWNVFRYMDKQNLLRDFLSKTSEKEIKEAELILWSYSPHEQSNWSWLNKARLEFGETVARGSEPDIIILTDKVLYFLEAKLTATNVTTPSNHVNRKKYETGGNNGFQRIFRNDYKTIAISNRYYELMRFWLLGSWIAEQLGMDFEFCSLVMNSRDENIEAEFGNQIIQSSGRKFYRMTWEQIYGYISKQTSSNGRQIMTDYIENKTIGYRSGNIVKAFEV